MKKKVKKVKKEEKSQELKFVWDVCAMCGVMVRCPKCGMNCCSGGYGKLKNGKPCPICPLAYQYQDDVIAKKGQPTERKIKSTWTKEQREEFKKVKKSLNASRVKWEDIQLL